MGFNGSESSAAGATRRFVPAPPSRGPFNIYYGWINTVGALICLTLAAGSVSYSFGLYIRPAAAELELTRAQMNLGLIIFHIGSALAHPLLGTLFDRLPAKALMRLCSLSFLIGAVGVALSSSPLLIALFIVGPLAIGQVGAGGLFGVVLISRWFSDRRARALSLAALGSSFGGMIVFPLTAFLMDAVGSWRTTLLIVAVAVTAITLLVSFIVKEKPDEDTARQLAERAPPLASGDGKHALAPQKILSTREFWLIAIPAALLLGVDQSVLATLAPYMQDRGFLTVQTATIMSSITASAICGKLFFAWVADRIDLRILMASTALVTIVQCIALMLAPGYVPLLIVCLLTGVAIGGTYPLANALIVQQFGPASAGTAVGMYSPIMSFCASAGLYFIGAVFDRNGDYSFGFMTFAGVATLAIIMLLLIRRRPRGNATAHPIQQEAPTAT